MKKLILHLILASILTIFVSLSPAHAGIRDFFAVKLDLTKIPSKISNEIAKLDIKLDAEIINYDIFDGVNLGVKYRYEVEPSYLDQFYTRIDQYVVKGKINAGDVLEDVMDLPFSFSVERERSFYFVRQFKTKKQAEKAYPYAPKRLPLTADKALKELSAGDFVSIPATLNVLTEATARTATTAPVILEAQAKVYWLISGEFIVQVFKLDDTHVRLKILSKNGYGRGIEGGVDFSFQFMGIKVLDKQIDRLFERDLVTAGYEIKPGEQFIIDYVFDLNNREAKNAYNQILKTTFKFKDIVAVSNFKGHGNLKDKLISSFDKAEEIFAQDKSLPPKNRRISRIFKGFNDFREESKKSKFALIVASFKKDATYTENKITLTDKNEQTVQFFYPAYSRYMEERLGKGFFSLKDVAYQNNFGLIPRVKDEDSSHKDPDFGLTYERRDKSFRVGEQKYVQKFLMGQILPEISDKIDFKDWGDFKKRQDSKVYFQLILKSQGFNYLRAYSKDEIREKFLDYVVQRHRISTVYTDDKMKRLKEFLNMNKVTQSKVLKLADDIYAAIRNETNNSEDMLRKIVHLNEGGLFDKVGVGFMISLLPSEKLEELIYVKLEISANKTETINFEYGKLNYAVLYKELADAQARIANRSYDLRVTDQDHESEDVEAGTEEWAQSPWGRDTTVANDLESASNEP
jgi:hypothetical protein